MPAPFPPDCLARFEPEAPLASGGYGTVWRARDRQLGRPAAVKVLLAAGASDPEQVARFHQEARITASITHPHVVRVLDSGGGATPWIAYELLPGPTLRALLEPGPLAPARALAIALQIASALRAAHAAGVLHRDVKPENVLGAGPDHFKVTDFGIARCTREGAVRTATGVILGTPHYIAPEVIQGAAPDARADLYALGVLLFELVAGRAPFDGASAAEILRQHIHSGAPLLGEVRPGAPGAVEALIARALAKAPGERFAGAGEMCAAIERAQSELDRPRSRPAPRPAPRSVPPSGASGSRGVTRPVSSSGIDLPTPAPRRSLALAALAIPLSLALLAVAIPRSPRPPTSPPAPPSDPRARSRAVHMRMLQELLTDLRVVRRAAIDRRPGDGRTRQEKRADRLRRLEVQLGPRQLSIYRTALAALMRELPDTAADLPAQQRLDPELAAFAHTAHHLYALGRLFETAGHHEYLEVLRGWVARHPASPLGVYLVRMIDRALTGPSPASAIDWRALSSMIAQAAPDPSAPRWRHETWVLWQADIVRGLDHDESKRDVREAAVWNAGLALFAHAERLGWPGLPRLAADVVMAFDGQLIARCTGLEPGAAAERTALIQGWRRRALALSAPADTHDALVLAETALLLERLSPPTDRRAGELVDALLARTPGHAFVRALVEAWRATRARSPAAAAALETADSALAALPLPDPDEDPREQRLVTLLGARLRLAEALIDRSKHGAAARVIEECRPRIPRLERFTDLHTWAFRLHDRVKPYR